MAQIAIEKAYVLKAIGGQEVYDDLERIAKKFKEIYDLKRDLNNQKNDAVRDSAEYKELDARLKEVSKQYRAVKRELEALKAQVKSNTKAEQLATEATKRHATEKVAAAKAATEAAKQETEASKQATQESVKGLNEERKAAAALHTQHKQLMLDRAKARGQKGTGLPGSYNDVATQYRLALQNVKSTVNMQDVGALQAAQAELMKLKTQLDGFNRSLTQDKVLIGEYTSGVMNAFKKMGLGHLISEQVDTAKASLNTLNTQFEQLSAELRAVKQTGVGSLDAVERQLVENRQAALQLQQQLSGVQSELRKTGSIGSQVTRAIGNEFKNLKQNIMQFVIGYMGVHEMIRAIRSSIRINYELSDTFADIQNRIHGSKEEVDGLIESLKQLDTRSSLSSLVDIAAIVSKKGVAKDEIVGITESIDNLMVALGGEMGDPKEAVSTLVKLVTVYSEDKQVTAKNIDAIAGAIARLSTSGIASGEFLVDFSERMAGVRGITGITIDKVLGLGAALQEIGQRTEVSATAMSQIIIKLFTDSQKYADITGKSLADFKAQLNDDVLGTFVDVAEKLKGNAGEIEAIFENTVDMHLKGSRAISVIGDIAGNIEHARKRMGDATRALNEHGVVADMAATKQQNFAASVDRVRKSFELLAQSKGVVATLNASAKAVEVLLKSLPTLLVLMGLMTAGWVAQNTQLVILRARLLYVNVVLAGQRILLGALSIGQAAYAASLGVLTGVTRIATAATAMFNTTLAASPLGAAALLIIGLSIAAGALAGGIYYLTNAFRGNNEALKDHARLLLLQQEVKHKAELQDVDTANKIKTLTSVIKDRTASTEAQTKALKELKEIGGDYTKDLTIQSFETEKATNILDEYVDSFTRLTLKTSEAQVQLNKYLSTLKKKAEYEAVASIQADLAKKRLELDNVEYGLLQKKANGKLAQSDLSETEKKYLPSLVSPERMSAFSDLDAALDNVHKKQAEVDEKTRIADKLISKALKEKLAAEAAVGRKKEEIEATFQELKDLRDAHYKKGDSQYESLSQDMTLELEAWFEAGGKAPKDIEAEIEKWKRKLYDGVSGEATKAEARYHIKALRDELEHSFKMMDKDAYKYKGSRLSGGETNGMKLANAERDNKLTALKTAYMEEDALKKTYNGRMIDNERTYLEESQKIEQAAIQQKIETIVGSNPAEQQARAKLHLEMLESQKKYNDKYFQIDAEGLNARLEQQKTEAKIKMEAVTDTNKSTDYEKATAKEDYYSHLVTYYQDYMSRMDDLDQKYHKTSAKNAAKRAKVLQEIEHKHNMSVEQMNREAVNQAYKYIQNKEKDSLLKLTKSRIEATRKAIADPTTGPGKKKDIMERISQRSELDMLAVSDNTIDKELKATERLYGKKLLNAREYHDKLKELNERALNNEVQRYNLLAEMDARNLEHKRQVMMGGLQVAETIGQSMMQAAAQRDAIEDRRRDREQDWNRRKLESQVQSAREKDNLDKAMMLEQDRRDRDAAEKQKRRTLQAMAIEYAAAALKIVAANIWRPDGLAQISIQEGILAATYAAKIGLAASTPAYGEGGDVPGDGGEFGGNSHSRGGTPFMFRGRTFEAEAKELAIVNKRSAQSNKVITLSGTPKQIASGVNAYGGGRDFAPGWSKATLSAPSFDSGKGWLAEHSQVPRFIGRHYERKHEMAAYGGQVGGSKIMQGLVTNSTDIAKTTAAVMALTSHVHQIQVKLNPHEVSSYNKGYDKAVQVGTI